MAETRRLTYNTIDASDWLEQRNSKRQPERWWVVMMCNKNGGEHTKSFKTTKPHDYVDASPQREGNKLWEVSNIVLTETEEVADGILELLHSNIRGSVSKATFLDVISTRYELKDHYGSFEKIFKIPGADSRLERISGPVELTE